MKDIQCIVNGREVHLYVEETEILTDMLRNRLGLTSVKKGCEVGECGACAVLMDGKTVNTCIMPAAWANGKTILTTEGLADEDGNLNDLQTAFIEEGAVQCGFCTPGMLMTATEILNDGKHHTREELRRGISGHLCRCTGYENILNAIERVQKEKSEK